MVPYSKKHFQVSLSHEIPSDWTPRTIDHSKPLYGKTGGAETLIQFSNLPEYSLSFIDTHSSAEEIILYFREQPVYILIVQLQNTLQGALTESLPIRHLEWSFNFYYSPTLELNIHFQPDGNYQTFCLIVPEGFMHYFGKEQDSIRNFHARSKAKKPISLMQQPKICPLPILQRIIDVQKNGMGNLDLRFAESLLTDLFASASSLPFRRMQYDEKIIDRLYALKAFLQQDPGRQLTRSELMNRFRLTAQQFHQGFADIYNFTPFAFLKYLRNQEE